MRSDRTRLHCAWPCALALSITGCTLDATGLGIEAPQEQFLDAGVEADASSHDADASPVDAKDSSVSDQAHDVPVDSKESGLADVEDSGGTDVSLQDTGPDVEPDDGAIDVAQPDAPVVEFCSPDPELAACYRFDDALSLVRDGSSYGNHGTVTGPVALAPGVSGTAVQTTTGSLLFVNDSPSLDVPALTIETWLRPQALPAGARSGILDNDGQYGLFLLASGALRCTAGNATAETAAIMPVGVWSHVACTYDISGIRIYFGGVLAAQGAAGGAINTAGTTGVAIGSNSPAGDNFVGMIDDMRVWRIARTAQDICLAAGTCNP